MPAETQPAVAQDERRRALLDASLRVFSRRGIAGARMAEIAAAAGVSPGLAYYYFPSKEAIFHALVERALAGAAAVTAACCAGPGSPWERLRRLCAQMLSGLERQPEHVFILIHVAVGEGVPGRTRALREEVGARVLADVRRLIADGQAAGEVAAGDPAQLARLLVATIQGLAVGAMGGAAAPLPPADAVLRVLAPLRG